MKRDNRQDELIRRQNQKLANAKEWLRRANQPRAPGDTVEIFNLIRQTELELRGTPWTLIDLTESVKCG